MDFALNEQQNEIVSALRAVLQRYAGAARTRIVMDGNGFDETLHSQLDELGVFDPDFAVEYGAHMGSVLVEEAVRHGALIPVGMDIMLRGPFGIADVDGPIAVLRSNDEPGVPFGAQAKAFVVIGDEDVRLVEGGATTGVENRTFGLPVAPVTIPVDAPSRVLDISPEAALAWWRIATTAETVGAASAALAITLEHLKARQQFGRPLASLQAIQHRLADLHVRIEGTRWLSRHAAWQQADPGTAATAAAYAVSMARAAIWELQQLQGAIGFTKEYDLHLFTLRLHVLRLILDGSGSSPAEDAADYRWAAAEQ